MTSQFSNERKKPVRRGKRSGLIAKHLVDDIRKLYSEGYTARQIHTYYKVKSMGISYSTIYNIISRRTYKDDEPKQAT